MKSKYLIIFLFIVLFFISGCSEISKITDKCKTAFEDCKYSCGDGILSSICKEKCTYQYDKCKSDEK